MLSAPATEREVRVPAGAAALTGTLVIPAQASGAVLFAHGSGSGRRSPRNRAVTRVLQEAGLATLLFDLLTAQEEAVDEVTAQWRFDISKHPPSSSSAAPTYP